MPGGRPISRPVRAHSRQFPLPDTACRPHVPQMCPRARAVRHGGRGGTSAAALPPRRRRGGVVPPARSGSPACLEGHLGSPAPRGRPAVPCPEACACVWGGALHGAGREARDGVLEGTRRPGRTRAPRSPGEPERAPRRGRRPLPGERRPGPAADGGERGDDVTAGRPGGGRAAQARGPRHVQVRRDEGQAVARRVGGRQAEGDRHRLRTAAGQRPRGRAAEEARRPEGALRRVGVGRG